MNNPNRGLRGSRPLVWGGQGGSREDPFVGICVNSSKNSSHFLTEPDSLVHHVMLLLVKDIICLFGCIEHTSPLILKTALLTLHPILLRMRKQKPGDIESLLCNPTTEKRKLFLWLLLHIPLRDPSSPLFLFLLIYSGQATLKRILSAGFSGTQTLKQKQLNQTQG